MMKAVIQRVGRASVSIESKETRSIGQGLVVLLGIGRNDESTDVKWLTAKITKMRLFEDLSGKFSLSVTDLSAEVLVASQFTLMASTRRGNRPSWDYAAPADEAKTLYEEFLECLGKILGKGKLVSGEFGALMEVELLNKGPCTIIVDSKEKF